MILIKPFKIEKLYYRNPKGKKKLKGKKIVITENQTSRRYNLLKEAQKR